MIKPKYISGVVTFYKKTPMSMIHQIIESLSLATECLWYPSIKDGYECKHKDIASQLKPTIIKYIIQENKNVIKYFQLDLYNMDVFPDVSISIGTNQNHKVKIWKKEVKNG